jgi:hypothetical protein
MNPFLEFSQTWIAVSELSHREGEGNPIDVIQAPFASLYYILAIRFLTGLKEIDQISSFIMGTSIIRVGLTLF